MPSCAPLPAALAADVTGVPGVVTAVNRAGSARGFWLQHTGRDDPAASPGLFVFTGRSTPDVRPGDEVLVSGTVDDHHADAPPAQSVLLPLTELIDPVWTVVSSGNPLPEPVLLEPGSVPETFAPDAGGASIVGSRVRPERSALDFYAAHENDLPGIRPAEQRAAAGRCVEHRGRAGAARRRRRRHAARRHVRAARLQRVRRLPAAGEPDRRARRRRAGARGHQATAGSRAGGGHLQRGEPLAAR